MGRKKTRCEECRKARATFQCKDCGMLYCRDCADKNARTCDCFCFFNIQKIEGDE